MHLRSLLSRDDPDQLTLDSKQNGSKGGKRQLFPFVLHCAGLFSLPWPLMPACQPAAPSTCSPACSKASPAFGASLEGHTPPGTSGPGGEHTLTVHTSTPGRHTGSCLWGAPGPHTLGSVPISLAAHCAPRVWILQAPTQGLLQLEPLDEREPEQRESNHILPKLNH